MRIGFPMLIHNSFPSGKHLPRGFVMERRVVFVATTHNIEYAVGGLLQLSGSVRRLNGTHILLSGL